MGKVFFALIVIFLVGGSVAIWQATSDTAAHVLMPHQLATERADRERIRVVGVVSASQPIDYKLEPQIELRFGLEDKQQPGVLVPVVYRGAKPDMFAAGRDVIIDGDWRSGVMIATQLLTQCPSKSEAPSSPDSYNASQKMEK